MRKQMAVWAVVLLGLALLPQSHAQENASSLLVEADRLANDGQLTQARALYEKALQEGQRLDTDPQTFGNAHNPARTTLGFGLARQVVPGWRVALALDNATSSARPEVLGYTAPPRSVLLSLQATLK